MKPYVAKELRQIDAFLSLGLLEEHVRVIIHKGDREPPETVIFYFETPDAYYCKHNDELALYSKESYEIA